MAKDERSSEQVQGIPDQQESQEAFDSDDRAEAVMTMVEIYGAEVDPEKVEQYLAVLHWLRRRKRRCSEPGESPSHI